MTERVISQLQTTEMWLSQRVHRATLRTNLLSCEVRKAVNVEPLFHRIEKIPATLIQPLQEIVPRKVGQSFWLYLGKVTQRSIKDHVAWSHLQSGLVQPWCGATQTNRGCRKL